MQREIKFRVWDIFYNKFIYSDQLEDGMEEFWRIVRHGKEEGRKVPVEQSTGLHDKNGEEIWEGDIIMPIEKRYPFYDEGKPNYVAVVEWCFAGFHYVLHLVNKNKKGISDGVNEPLEEGEWCKVIGNIYAKPSQFYGWEANGSTITQSS